MASEPKRAGSRSRRLLQRLVALVGVWLGGRGQTRLHHSLSEQVAELARLALKRDRTAPRLIIAQVRMQSDGVEIDLASPAIAQRLGVTLDRTRRR